MLSSYRGCLPPERGEPSKADTGVYGHWLESLEEFRTGNVFSN